MSDQTTRQQRYKVSIHEAKDGSGDLGFTFVPKGIRHARQPGDPSERVPQYIVWARGNGSTSSLDWEKTVDDPGPAKSDIEKKVHQRITDRTTWLNRVSDLVADVERWGGELGWSTRRIDKQLDDTRVGRHTVPALLMQDETVRVLLEPVSRSVPGGEGLVDLSLMPAYDDIASLYYREDRWHLHYIFPNAKTVATVRSAESKPLSKDALALVLDELKKRG